MILVQNKFENGTILIQKPYKLKSSNFTILLQNILTKEIHLFNVTTTSSKDSLYLKFENINFSNWEDGEYYLLLINNPLHSKIEVSYNNINDFKRQENIIYFLLNKSDYIMNGELYVGYSVSFEDVIKITSDIVKIGTYKNPTLTYNKDTKYIQYNG